MENTLYKKIFHALKHAIDTGIIRSGERIPSIREIEKQYGVSAITARRVFKELKLSGLITRREGVGYFVSATLPSTRRNKTLAAVFRPPRPFNTIDNFGTRILNGIMEGCFANALSFTMPARCSFLRGKTPSEEECSAIAAELASINDLAGVIFDFRFSDEMLSRWLIPACRGVKTVVAGRKSDITFSTAMPVRECADDLVQLALRCNGKRFGLVSYDAIADQEKLLTCLESSLLAEGIPKERISFFSGREIFTDLCSEKLKHWIRSASEFPVFITAADTCARKICDIMKSSSLLCRKDYGVVSYGGYEMAFSVSPQLTCASLNAEKLGISAVEMIVNNEMYQTSTLYSDYKIVLKESL